jgi:hypothetical protein
MVGGGFVSFVRTFMAEVRRGLAAETETSPVGRVRFYAAGISILFGLLGVVLPLSMASGDVPWAALPGGLLLVAGGVLGIGAQRKADVVRSRWFGTRAALCTLVGLIEVCVVVMALG